MDLNKHLKFVLILTCMIFLVGTVSAFGEVKSFDPTIPDNGEIQIKDWYGLSNKADYRLTNYEAGIIDVWAEGQYKLYQETTLFDGVFYKNLKGGIGELSSIEFFIWKEETTTNHDPIYEKNCYLDYTNSTLGEEICENVEIGTKEKIEDTSHWIKYELGTELPESEGKWKFEAKRKPNKKIDFILEAHGKTFDEWAWFNETWNLKKSANVTFDGSPDLSDFWVEVTIPFETGKMAIDWSDLRILNANENATHTFKYDYKNSTEMHLWIWAEEGVGTVENGFFEYYIYYNTTTPVTYGWDTGFYYGDTFVNVTSHEWTTGETSSGSFALDTTYSALKYTGNGVTGKASMYENLPSAVSDWTDITIQYKTTWANHIANDGSYHSLGVTATGSNPTDTWIGAFLNGRDASYGNNLANAWANDVLGTTKDVDKPDLSNPVTATIIQTGNSDSSSVARTQRHIYSANGFTGDYVETTSSYQFTTSPALHIASDDRWAGQTTYTFYILISHGNGTVESFAFGEEQEASTMEFNLNSPIDYYNSTSNNVLFNCSVTEDVGVYSLNLSIDNVVVETVTGDGTTDLSLQSTETVADGDHIWYCTGESDAETKNSTTRYLTVDTSSPELNLTNPMAGTYTDEYTTTNNNTVQLNWTISDTHLDSCWYSNDSGATNNSLTCGDNTTTLYFPYGSHSLDIWANDTLGNENSDSVNFTLAYKIYENYVNYSNQTYETARESFAINVTLGEDETISAYLVYDGMAYSATRTGTDQTYLFSNSLILDEAGNNSFYWMFNYGGDYINSSTFYQNVSEISFTNCTSGTKFLTVELRDEETQELLDTGDNITMKVNLLYYLEDISVNKTFNNSFSSNTVSFCLTPATENVSVFGELEYDDDTHVKRRYYFLYDTFTNETTTLPLYDLKSTDSTSFVVYLEDSSSVGVGDAYMELKKKYLEIDKYKTIEMSKTDEYGMSILHFVSEDDKYIMNFYDSDGDLLYSAPEFPAVCLDTVCSLTFKIPYSISLDPFSSITEDQNFEYLLTMTDSDVITLVFNSQNGIGYNVLFDVYGMSIINDTVSICEESETNAGSGTLTCDISAQNFETFLVRIWIDGDLQVSRYISPEDDTWKSYGKEGLIYTLFIVIILSLLFAWDWRLCLVGTVVGLAVSTWLKFIPGTISTISYIVVVVIYLLIQGGDK